MAQLTMQKTMFKMNLFIQRLLRLVLVFLATLCVGVVSAETQNWPTRAVKIVVPYPAGGGVDILARALAQKLQEAWDQPVTVDNRPGANTLVGTEVVARAKDQHTLLFTTDATFTINPHLYTKLPYELARDFKPITQVVSFSQMLVVNVDFPANSLDELIALARNKPGSLSYASYGPGSQPQLATEMLKQKAGIFILHIPYRGIPQAVAAVVSNEIPMTWSGVVSARPHIASKRIKPIAFGGKTRLAAYPQVPTTSELGYPEIDSNVWVGLFGPSNMQSQTIHKIHQDILKITNDPAFRRREIESKSYDLVGNGPDEFMRYISHESESRKATLKTAGVKID